MCDGCPEFLKIIFILPLPLIGSFSGYRIPGPRTSSSRTFYDLLGSLKPFSASILYMMPFFVFFSHSLEACRIFFCLGCSEISQHLAWIGGSTFTHCTGPFQPASWYLSFLEASWVVFSRLLMFFPIPSSWNSFSLDIAPLGLGLNFLTFSPFLHFLSFCSIFW